MQPDKEGLYDWTAAFLFEVFCRDNFNGTVTRREQVTTVNDSSLMPISSLTRFPVLWNESAGCGQQDNKGRWYFQLQLIVNWLELLEY